MSRMIIRMALAIGVAILLAIAGVNGNAIVLQTLFTVLGIVFSISMSLLVSFSLTKYLITKYGIVYGYPYCIHVICYC